ncbi:MAG: polysaccharide deacetylase family protein, partial [Maritimibacter sp.]|nr:polysaccharide deacetylase family protein [Maritimibacter sp.]
MTKRSGSGSGPIPILMYHSVDPHAAPDYARWAVPPEVFRRQMQIIADEGYRPVTLSQLAQEMDRAAVREKLVCITFDDGLMDFVTGAMPVLADFGFVANLFVATGYVGTTARWLGPLGEGARPMMGWSELREVAGAGIECGGHSVSHRELDTLGEAEARDEIFGSVRALEDRLGRAVTTFAYPFGYASATTRALVRAAGVVAACRVTHGLATAGEDRYGLSRIIATADIPDARFGDFLAGRRLPVAPVQRSAKRRVWRAWRTARHRLTGDDRAARAV